MEKQSEAYKNFTNDVRPKREKHWLSIFHQLSAPVCLEDVNSVLEFGPGRGLLGAILRYYGLDYTCSDVKDHGARPDFMHNIMGFPSWYTYDLVCAFQALEHNPPETFVPHLQKMSDISNKYVFISMPYSGRWLSFNVSFNIPKFNMNITKIFSIDRLIPVKRPIEKYRQSKTPYSHHWFEIGDPGFKKKELHKYAQQAGLKIKQINHSNSFPYHIFILMEKQ